MKRSFKKFVAVLTATTLLLSSSVMAIAAESEDGATSVNGTVSGNGAVEDYLNKDVFKVTLPTVANVDFTIDPQGLLGVADEDAYTLGAGAVYFANVSGNSATYSNVSDAITIGNKSSYDVDVNLTVNLTAAEGITMVDSADDLADAKTPSLYLAIQEAGDEAATAITEASTELETKAVEGIDEAEDAYEIVAESDGAGGYTYKYVLSADYAGTPAEASYTLTGACDTTADWSSVKDMSVRADLVWEVAKHIDNMKPSIKVSSIALAADQTTFVIPYSLGAGELAATAIEKTNFTPSTTGITKDFAEYIAEDDGSKLYINEKATTYFKSNPSLIKIKFNDGTICSVNVAAAQ